MRIAAALVLLCAMVPGCAVGAKHIKKIQSRASFELTCDAAQLKLNVLESYDGCLESQGEFACAKIVGVAGCGKQTIYVLSPDGTTWIRNGEITPAGS